MIDTRREFLLTTAAVWAQAVARAHQHAATEPASAPQHAFVFFQPKERETLRALMDRIVPPDERSTGALGARVDEYIDFILSHAEPPLQQQWRDGLRRYRTTIHVQDASAIGPFLAQQAKNEFDPHSEDERFFVLLKYAVTEGFYTSREGIDNELGYRGMGFVLDFQGCTHPNHESPPGWKPILRQRKV
jgi:Gluconate 2-dehydrogenase subunit 3